ncbi:MAG: hypothetical protein H6Q75_353 [Firmicutes bacterium]|nr:hypothetical protein [Bacillota bacterium]
MKKRIILALIGICFSVVTGFAAPAPEKEIMSDLKGFHGSVGVFAKNLNTGKTLQFNQDAVFPTASTSKVIVALAVYKYLYPAAGSDQISEYEQDIRLMITVSDNDSFNDLLDKLTNRDALDKVVKDFRLRQTRIHNEEAFKKYKYHSVTTPYEMAKVFEKVYGEKYLEKEKSQRFKSYLANTIFHDEIPRYMETPVLHKVGELDAILCDVGVIQDGYDPVLISFYTNTSDHEYASNFIATQSAKIYNVLRHK